jgi:phosphopantetheinyl transferase
MPAPDEESDCRLRFERIDTVLRERSGREELGRLSPREAREYDHWKTSGRRNAFLAGRILAKQLLRETFALDGVADRSLEIVSRTDDCRRGIAPEVRIGGTAGPFPLSIAHTDEFVLVGCSTRRNGSFGADLVARSLLPEGFRRLWFSEEEHKVFMPFPEEVWLRAWSAKEAAFKASGGGRRFVPRELRAIPRDLDCWTVSDSARGGEAVSIRIGRVGDHLIAYTSERGAAVGPGSGHRTFENSVRTATNHTRRIDDVYLQTTIGERQ